MYERREALKREFYAKMNRIAHIYLFTVCRTLVEFDFENVA